MSHSRALERAPSVTTFDDPDPSPALSMLWLVDVDYQWNLEHGANLRIFNYTQALMAQGHQIYFAVTKKKTDDPVAKKNYLDDLRRKRIITDYVELEYKYPPRRGKLAQLVLYPALSNFLLREAQAPVIADIKQLIASRNIDLCIFVDRQLLFALPEITPPVRTMVDWIDSNVLYRLREIRFHWKKHQFSQIPAALRYLVSAFGEESYYGKHGTTNLVVSPVDKKYIDFVNRVPHLNRVLMNGVQSHVSDQRASKIRRRMIFTGNMDFPPNYQSAIWFIDHVFPQLLARQGDLQLVIAGTNPVKELRAKAGPHIEITGYVPDMKEEIAKSELYVAPLISGGGFKNKVVEAITSGTFVVATSVAVEFLGENIRQHLLVADTPEEMVEAILAYFEHPPKYEAHIKILKRIIDEEFSWENRTKEFLAIARAS